MNDPKAELWEDYFKLKKQGDSQALQEIEQALVVEYLYIVRYIASRLDLYLETYMDSDDLFSSGVIGLIDAIKKFDETKNTSFLTYATLRIRGAMLDEVRKLDWIPRTQRKNQKQIEETTLMLEQKLSRKPSPMEISEALNLNLKDYYKIEAVKQLYPSSFSEIEESECKIQNFQNNTLPNEYAFKKERETILLDTLKKLPENERLVIYYYYFEGLKLKEISKKLHLGESRASQLHKKALKTLNTLLKSTPHADLFLDTDY